MKLIAFIIFTTLFLSFESCASNAKQSIKQISILNELEENEDYLAYVAMADQVLKNKSINQAAFFDISLEKAKVLAKLNQTEKAYENLAILTPLAEGTPYFQGRIIGTKAKIKSIEGRKIEAYKLFQEAIKKNNETDKEFHLDCLLEMASLEDAKELNDTTEEIESFIKIHKINMGEPYFSLSSIFFDNGEYQKALSYIDRARRDSLNKKNNRYLEIMLLKGGILQELRKLDDSKIVYKEILKKKPKSALDKRIYALASIEVNILENNYKQAFYWLKSFLKLTPVTSKNYRDSLRHSFEVLLQQNEKKINNEDSFFILSKLELFLKDEDILLLNSGVISLFEHFFNRHSEIKDIERKKNILEEDLGKYGIFQVESKISDFFWGNFYLHYDDLVNSKKYFYRLTNKYPNSPLGWGGLQNVTTKEGNYIESITNYHKAKKLAGKDVWVSYLQTPLLRLYDHAMGKLSIKEVELIGPGIILLVPEYENVVHATLGHFYYDKGAYDLAEKEFNKSIETIKSKEDAHRDEPYIMLGNIYFKKGKHQESKKYYLDALNVRSDSRYALLGLGKVFATEKNLERMLFYYNKAIKYSSNALGFQSDSREFEEGVYSKANYDLGEYFEGVGNKKMALVHYNKATTYGYKNQKEEALKKVERLLNSN